MLHVRVQCDLQQMQGHLSWVTVLGEKKRNTSKRDRDRRTDGKRERGLDCLQHVDVFMYVCAVLVREADRSNRNLHGGNEKVGFRKQESGLLARCALF